MYRMTNSEARRRAAMTKLRERGWTYQRIADKYGVTRQRVWQILNQPPSPEARVKVGDLL
jgi:transcriptional regulator with XRE-family HTH domain